MTYLAEKKCVPREGGVPPFVGKKLMDYVSQLHEKWEVVEGKKIRYRFSFKNFKEAMEFVNKIAEIAEDAQHHPDIKIAYNKVIIELWTHAIDGLSENDFILAAKIERVRNESHTK